MEENKFDMSALHPALAAMTRNFLLKCNYAFGMDSAGSIWQGTDGQGNRVYHRSTVYFFDPETIGGTLVGALKIISINNDKIRYRVVTRTTINYKFRDSERRCSIETTSEKRALQVMLKYLTPLALSEIAKECNTDRNVAISQWRNEFEASVTEAFNVPTPAIIREIENMVAHNIPFATPEFQKVYSSGIPALRESQARHKVKFHSHFVLFSRAGGIKVMTQPANALPVDIKVYTSFNELPEAIREGVSMLQILSGTNQRIPGLGAKVNERSFWVLERDTQNA